MTIVLPTPTRQRFDQLTVRPHLPLYLDFTRGLKRAVSGQAPTYSRTGTQTVTGSFGGTLAVGADVIPLSAVGGLVGYAQSGGALRYDMPSAPVYPMIVAWDGVPVSGGSDAVMWRIGSATGTSSYFELRKVGGAATMRAIYVNASSQSSTGELTSVPLGERLFAVAILDAGGAATLAIRTMAGTYTTSAAGTARGTITAWGAAQMHVMSLNGSSQMASNCNRLLVQHNVAAISDLSWGW